MFRNRKPFTLGSPHQAEAVLIAEFGPGGNLRCETDPADIYE